VRWRQASTGLGLGLLEPVPLQMQTLSLELAPILDLWPPLYRKSRTTTNCRRPHHF
jgi:hypothetical protein